MTTRKTGETLVTKRPTAASKPAVADDELLELDEFDLDVAEVQAEPEEAVIEFDNGKKVKVWFRSDNLTGDVISVYRQMQLIGKKKASTTGRYSKAEEGVDLSDLELLANFAQTVIAALVVDWTLKYKGVTIDPTDKGELSRKVDTLILVHIAQNLVSPGKE